MKVEIKEKAKIDSNCEIRFGVASWDDGSEQHKSVKYTWFDVKGKASRGGEIPVEALPQMLELALKNDYLSL